MRLACRGGTRVPPTAAVAAAAAATTGGLSKGSLGRVHRGGLAAANFAATRSRSVAVGPLRVFSDTCKQSASWQFGSSGTGSSWHARATASAASASDGDVPAELLDVAQSSPEGLMVGNKDVFGKGRLARGVIVSHQGARWVCIFQIDRYWYAAPLGQHSEGAAACLRRSTPLQADRAPLAAGIATGVLAVDTLAPIGVGQSMLICGPAGSGKTTLAQEVVDRAVASGRFEHVVSFEDGAHPADGLASLFACVDTAEVARNAGGNALVVLDTVAPLLGAWERALEWAEAARGAPLDTDSLGAQRRAVFAGLLERAAHLVKGGTLTILAIVETEAMAAIQSAIAAVSGASVDDGAGKIYTIDDFVGRKTSEITRLRSLVDRNVALTDKTLKTIGIVAPGSDADVQRKATVEAAVRELQSLSDGQIVLDASMAENGVFPAINAGATFSRFGLGSSAAFSDSGDAESAARAAGSERKARDVRPPALQSVAAHLRTQLALERESHFRPAQESTTSTGADLRKATAADSVQSKHMEAVRLAFVQPPHASLEPEEMTVLLVAACSGALVNLPRAELATALGGGSGSTLLTHLRDTVPSVLESLSQGERIDTKRARELDVAIRLFVALRQTAGACSPGDASDGTPVADSA
eukprot:TRINITY_DN3136_c1_g2_i1.p1 TRINITY_DN3136_c1_g2~~TRINITY_DN3136_c1_g2_i1.p1  ORF type:complete len:643 (-),score=120.53 TRINITY_DN3136_c1_g2_i1:287-2215(-)